MNVEYIVRLSGGPWHGIRFILRETVEPMASGALWFELPPTVVFQAVTYRLAQVGREDGWIGSGGEVIYEHHPE